MEARLFWIGVVLGLYAWATRKSLRTKRLSGRWSSALWHALFCASAAFSAALVAIMSIESRTRFSGVVLQGLLSKRELYPSLLAALAAGTWGLSRAYFKGKLERARRGFMEEDLEWAETVSSAVLLASVMMYFVVQAFKIPSGSMRETLKEGDHIFVNKFIYGVRVPFTDWRLARFSKAKRGDVVVFRFPTQDVGEVHCGSIQYGKDFIKRAVAVGGDTVQVARGRLVVNGRPIEEEPYAQYADPVRQSEVRYRLSREIYQKLWEERRLDVELRDGVRDHFGPVRVPDGSVFVMGDNRDRSCDSRFWGAVDDKYLKGKGWFVYWPPSRIGVVR